ncbi:MAG TPA: efflux RND transporter periplasmic adaptor subunit [Candidatus Didemnitutus sp.]|jgi:cobalt-zinc-cadmium efflux system membrane fusion protein
MKNKLLPVCAAALLAGCSPQPDHSPEPLAVAGNVTLTAAQRGRIRVQAIQPVTFYRAIEATGTVGFDNDRATTVLAPISGPVTRLLVSLGAHVEAGEALAVVDSPDYAAAISAYRKAVVTARNFRRIADLDRQLFASDAIARREVEQAETDAVNGDADRDAAAQQLRSLGLTDEAIRDIQEDRPPASIAGIIRAPLAGTVVEKLITPGQLLQAGSTPCFTVADLSQMWVAADVFEGQLPSIAVGDPAEVFTNGNPTGFPGTVDNIGAILDPATRAISVRIVAQNPGQALKKQMYVRVVIHSRRPTTGLLAPVAAILRDDQNLPFLYVAQPDGTFARHHVTLGSRVGDDYEIIAGLTAGEQLVADGGLFVQFLQNQ